MNKSGVIGTLCNVLFIIGAIKFTTKDSRNRLYDAGLHYLEIQKENMNKTIQITATNLEKFFNSSRNKNSKTNNKTSLQPDVE